MEELQVAGAKKLKKKKNSEWRNVSTDVIPMRQAELNLKKFNQNIRIPHLFRELRTSAKSIILKLETNTSTA